MKEKLRECPRCGRRLLLEEKLLSHNGKQFCYICIEKSYPRCKHCNNRYYRNKVIRLSDGQRFCKECYKNETFACDYCKGIFSSSEKVTTTVDTHYCRHCAGSHTFFCEDCENIFDRADKRPYRVCSDNRVVCIECRDHNYIYCDNCGIYRHSGDVYYCERCNVYYCNSCEHSCCDGDFRETILAHQYGTKNGKYLTINRLIGVEIEAENGDLCKLSEELDNRCGIAEDGSLNSKGAEVITPPASLNEAEKIIKDACMSLKKAGFDATRSCGIHIHIDARDFKNSPVKLARVLRTVYAVEDLLLSILPPSRWDNRYCLRLSTQYSFNNFRGKIRIDDFESKWYKTVNKLAIKDYKTQKHDSKGTRYCGLNMHSTMYRGTIEFRYHSGTIDWQKILKWAYILLKVINYATKRYEDKEIIALYSQPTTQSKLRKFFMTFRIRKEIQHYMKARIEKFNPGFKYYNNGKGKENNNS